MIPSIFQIFEHCFDIFVGPTKFTPEKPSRQSLLVEIKGTRGNVDIQIFKNWS